MLLLSIQQTILKKKSIMVSTKILAQLLISEGSCGVMTMKIQLYHYRNKLKVKVYY